MGFIIPNIVDASAKVSNILKLTKEFLSANMS